MDQTIVIETEASTAANAPASTLGIRLASLILTVAGLFYLYQAIELPMGDPPGTGVGAVPVLVAVCWVVFGAFVTVRNRGASADLGPWPRGSAALRVGGAFFLCVMFIVGLPFFGIFLTTGVFLLLMGRLAGAPWTSAVILSAATPVAFWIVFSLGLKVSLPFGSLLTVIFRG
jgi:Tripartite tricarboxylate transporter TctB family